MKDIKREKTPIPISFIEQFQDDMVGKRDSGSGTSHYDYYNDVVIGIAELLKKWEKEKGRQKNE